MTFDLNRKLQMGFRPKKLFFFLPIGIGSLLQPFPHVHGASDIVGEIEGDTHREIKPYVVKEGDILDTKEGKEATKYRLSKEALKSLEGYIEQAKKTLGEGLKLAHRGKTEGMSSYKFYLTRIDEALGESKNQRDLLLFRLVLRRAVELGRIYVKGGEEKSESEKAQRREQRSKEKLTRERAATHFALKRYIRLALQYYHSQSVKRVEDKRDQQEYEWYAVNWLEFASSQILFLIQTYNFAPSEKKARAILARALGWTARALNTSAHRYKDPYNYMIKKLARAVSQLESGVMTREEGMRQLVKVYNKLSNEGHRPEFLRRGQVPEKFPGLAKEDEEVSSSSDESQNGDVFPLIKDDLGKGMVHSSRNNNGDYRLSQTMIEAGTGVAANENGAAFKMKGDLNSFVVENWDAGYHLDRVGVYYADVKIDADFEVGGGNGRKRRQEVEITGSSGVGVIIPGIGASGFLNYEMNKNTDFRADYFRLGLQTPVFVVSPDKLSSQGQREWLFKIFARIGGSFTPIQLTTDSGTQKHAIKKMYQTEDQGLETGKYAGLLFFLQYRQVQVEAKLGVDYFELPLKDDAERPDDYRDWRKFVHMEAKGSVFVPVQLITKNDGFEVEGGVEKFWISKRGTGKRAERDDKQIMFYYMLHW